MKKTVVYDFDGTLSYGDSLEELFNSEMHGIKAVYKIYYYFLKVLSKLKISTVKREKEQMIKLLFYSDEQRFKDACERQAEGYRFSPIMDLLKQDLADGNRVIVLSASSVFFLEKIFGDMNVEILGSTFNVREGKILGIKQHPFYTEKVDTLVKHGIAEVDETYFDRKWDDCLKPMCRKWYKVKNGEIVDKGINE
ncbi:MAG: haloacid dehalogenase-like hydrolase [Prevotella sp.]|nr:haloacid dehalogenase-like hydrolase [Prevotella sp.]MBP3843993.1 haloacid dehalogenase-like hydrolase [Prevotella sp.]